MGARGIGVAAAVVSAVLYYSAFAAYVSLPLCAQQPVSSSAAGLGMALPADVQAKLDKLQAALNRAQAGTDLSAEAKTLNQMGELYLHASYYTVSLDYYSRARTAAGRAGHYTECCRIERHRRLLPRGRRQREGGRDVWAAAPENKDAVVLMEITMHNLMQNVNIQPADFLARMRRSERSARPS